AGKLVEEDLVDADREASRVSCVVPDHLGVAVVRAEVVAPVWAVALVEVASRALEIGPGGLDPLEEGCFDIGIIVNGEVGKGAGERAGVLIGQPETMPVEGIAVEDKEEGAADT